MFRALTAAAALVLYFATAMQCHALSTTEPGKLTVTQWSKDDQHPIARSILAWEDDESEDAPEQVLEKFHDYLVDGDSSWLQYNEQYPATPYKVVVLWAAMRIRNDGDLHLPLVLENNIVSVKDTTFFFYSEDGKVEQASFGSKHKFSERKVKHRHFLFPFQLQANSYIDVIARVRVAGNPRVVLDRTTLRHESFYLFQSGHIEILRWLYTGAMFLLFLMGLVAAVFTRERLYVFFVLLASSAVITQFIYGGYAQLYLWQDSSYLNERGFILSTTILFFSCIEFSRGFLDVRHSLPKLGKLCAFGSGLLLAMFILTCLIPVKFVYLALFIAAIIFLLSLLLILTCSFMLWARGQPLAGQFSVTWSIFILIMCFEMFQVFFMSQPNPFSRVSLDIWVLLLSMSLFVGLLRKLNQGRLERDRAIAQNRAKSEFLSNMAHEIRTPMNAILGFSSLMQQADDIPESQKENLAIINNSGEHLLRLINEVLDMSKIEAGRVSLLPANFDVIELLHDIEMMFSDYCDKHQLTLTIFVSNEVPRNLHADHGKLAQILTNLLGNAVKFTHNGTITLRAEAQPLEDNKIQLTIEVQDTGIGIRDSEKNKVFSSFKQTESGVASGEGTGLGLTISREYARMMGGDITFSSQYNKGSLFQVVIMCEDAQPNGAPAAAPAPRPIALQPTERQYRILIVDDKVSNRMLLQQLLAPLGFELEQATDGAQAIEMFNSWHPDLILMDDRMPFMGGAQATQEIRACDHGKDIPIIAITASAFEQDRERILAEGASEFICKPVVAEELIKKIGQQLNVSFVYQKDT